jgi:hypothetical protein
MSNELKYTIWLYIRLRIAKIKELMIVWIQRNSFIHLKGKVSEIDSKCSSIIQNNSNKNWNIHWYWVTN